MLKHTSQPLHNVQNKNSEQTSEKTNKIYAATFNWIIKFSPQSHGTFPGQLDHQPVVCICDTGSFRNLCSTKLLERVKGPNFIELVQKKVFPKIVDPQNRPLKVLGALFFQIEFGKFKGETEFVIYQSDMEYLLLGFKFMKENCLLNYPKLGILQEKQTEHSSAETECGLAAAETQNTPPFLHAGQDILIPAESTQNYLVPPGASVNCKVQLKLDNLSNEDKQQFKYECIILHSEALEKHYPLHKISVYYNYTFLNHMCQCIVHYVNHTKHTVNISKGQIIAHAQCLQPASREQVMTSNDAQAKYICSILDPVPAAVSTPEVVAQVQTSPKSQTPSFVTSRPESPAFTLNTQLNELRVPESKESESGKLENVAPNVESGDKSEIEFVQYLFDKYPNSFSISDYDVGHYKGQELNFTLKKDTKPFFSKAYPIPEGMKKESDLLIAKLLKQNIIEPSTEGPKFLSPFFFVWKAHEDLPAEKARFPGEKDYSKKRKLRAICNLSRLNSCLETAYTYPTMEIKHVLRRLHEAKVCAILDISAAFYCIKANKQCRPYLSFQYQDEIFQYICLPMGLSLSPALLSLSLNSIKQQHKLIDTEIWADNLIVHSTTTTGLKSALEKCVAAFGEQGFKFSKKKAHFFIRNSFQILGHVVDLKSHTMYPCQDKIRHIVNLPAPSSKRKLRGFIGALIQFQPHIYGLQSMLQNLHKMTSPKGKFVWSKDMDDDYKKILRSISVLPSLKLPSPNRPLILFTDGCVKYRRGANWAWFQRDENGHIYPVQFGSKLLSEQQCNTLSQVEVEGLVLTIALSNDISLTYFTEIHIYSDARSLQFMVFHSATHSKLARWLLFIGSLNVRLFWTPCSNPGIRLCDILGRNQDEVISELVKVRKPKKGDVDEQMYWSFENLPPMQFNDALELIRRCQRWQKADNIKAEPAQCKVSDPPPPPLLPCEDVGEGGEGQGDRNPELAAGLPSGEESSKQKISRWQLGPTQQFMSDLPSPPTSQLSFQYNLSTRHNWKIDRIRRPFPAYSTLPNPPSEKCDIPPILTNKEMDKLTGEGGLPTPTGARFLRILTSQLCGMPLASLIQQQRLDPKLGKLMDQITQGKKQQNYFLFEGLLLKGSSSPSAKITCPLPPALAFKFLKYIHETIHYFHLPTATMVKLLSRYFSVPRIHDIAKQVASVCQSCSLLRTYPQPNQKMIGRKFVVTRPREAIYIDECKFLTRGQTKSFLVIIDAFCLFTSIYCLPSPCTSQDIAQCIIQYISSYSAPFCATTDNASTNQSKVSQVLNLFGIKRYSIAAGHPQSNLSELANKLSLRLVAHLHQNLQLSDAALVSATHLAAFVINKTPLKSLQWVSPFQLFFGMPPTQDLTMPTVHLAPNTSYPEYVRKIGGIQNKLFSLVNEHKRKIEAKNFQKRDLKQKPLFSPGQYVRVKAIPDQTKLHHKLRNRWSKTICKIIRVSESSTSPNYFLLPLSEANALQWGFRQSTPIPKSKIIYVKQDRLKPVPNPMYLKDDDICQRIVKAFYNFAVSDGNLPKVLHFDPCPVTVAPVDPSLKVLIRKVLKERAGPQRQHKENQLHKYITDSVLGQVPHIDNEGVFSLSHQDNHETYVLKGKQKVLSVSQSVSQSVKRGRPKVRQVQLVSSAPLPTSFYIFAHCGTNQSKIKVKIGNESESEEDEDTLAGEAHALSSPLPHPPPPSKPTPPLPPPPSQPLHPPLPPPQGKQQKNGGSSTPGLGHPRGQAGGLPAQNSHKYSSQMQVESVAAGPSTQPPDVGASIQDSIHPGQQHGGSRNIEVGGPIVSPDGHSGARMRGQSLERLHPNGTQQSHRHVILRSYSDQSIPVMVERSEYSQSSSVHSNLSSGLHTDKQSVGSQKEWSMGASVHSQESLDWEDEFLDCQEDPVSIEARVPVVLPQQLQSPGDQPVHPQQPQQQEHRQQLLPIPLPFQGPEVHGVHLWPNPGHELEPAVESPIDKISALKAASALRNPNPIFHQSSKDSPGPSKGPQRGPGPSKGPQTAPRPSKGPQTTPGPSKINSGPSKDSKTQSKVASKSTIKSVEENATEQQIQQPPGNPSIQPSTLRRSSRSATLASKYKYS